MRTIVFPLALVVSVLVPVGSFVALWVFLDCYPWRPCGRCGWYEWRIFRNRR